MTVRPASDLKFNFLGHLNRVYGKDIPQPVQVGLKDGGVVSLSIEQDRRRVS